MKLDKPVRKRRPKATAIIPRELPTELPIMEDNSNRLSDDDVLDILKVKYKLKKDRLLEEIKKHNDIIKGEELLRNSRLIKVKAIDDMFKL